MNLAPIALFVYNRPWHTSQTVKALQKNDLANESELFIFSDGIKNEMAVKDVKEVRDYIRTIDGFKNIEIIERDKNLGLANSVIYGVTQIVNKYGKIIVLEDDLITSSYFLRYMNESLAIFQERKDIFSITGYSYPIEFPPEYEYEVFLSYRCMSWSWGTWDRCWNSVDWDKDMSFIKSKKKHKEFNRGGNDLSRMLISQYNGEIDSWAIQWCYNHYIHKAFCLHPKSSLIKNIGFDGSGVHCGIDEQMNTQLDDVKKINIYPDIQLNKEIASKIRKYKNIKPLPLRAYNKVMKLVNKRNA